MLESTGEKICGEGIRCGANADKRRSLLDSRYVESNLHVLRSVGLTFLYSASILSCPRAGKLSRHVYRIGGLPGIYSPFFPGSSLYLIS